MEKEEKDNIVLLTRLDEKFKSLEQRIAAIEEKIHDIRENLINPILAWQNRAIGLIIAVSTLGGYVFEWVKDIFATTGKH